MILIDIISPGIILVVPSHTGFTGIKLDARTIAGAQITAQIPAKKERREWISSLTNTLP